MMHPTDTSRPKTHIFAKPQVNEMHVVRNAVRVDVYLVLRTPTPDPEPPHRTTTGLGIDLGVANRLACSNGAIYPGVVEDRSEIKKRQRELSTHDHRHHRAGTNKHTPGHRRKVRAVAKAHARVTECERHSVHRLVNHIISLCVAHGVRRGKDGFTQVEVGG